MIYVLWRRSDGYIGASVGRIPNTFTGADGVVNTFTEILTSENWQEIQKRYDKEKEQK